MSQFSMAIMQPQRSEKKRVPNISTRFSTYFFQKIPIGETCWIAMNCYRSDPMKQRCSAGFVSVRWHCRSLWPHYSTTIQILQYPSSLLTWQDIAIPSYHCHNRRFEWTRNHPWTTQEIGCRSSWASPVSKPCVLVARWRNEKNQDNYHLQLGWTDYCTLLPSMPIIGMAGYHVILLGSIGFGGPLFCQGRAPIRLGIYTHVHIYII
jgi:hypothetical protein